MSYNLKASIKGGNIPFCKKKGRSLLFYCPARKVKALQGIVPKRGTPPLLASPKGAERQKIHPSFIKSYTLILQTGRIFLSRKPPKNINIKTDARNLHRFYLYLKSKYFGKKAILNSSLTCHTIKINFHFTLGEKFFKRYKPITSI